MTKKTVDLMIEQTGVSIAELTARSGLEEGRVQAIVDGRWLPSPTERQKIAQAFEVDTDQINWGHSLSPRNVRYHRFGVAEEFSTEQGKAAEGNGNEGAAD